MKETAIPLLTSRRTALVRGVAALSAAATVGGATSPDAAPATLQPLASIIDVRTLGAIGDGKANDTAALQRAIDLARSLPGGATVFLPAGFYSIDGVSLRPAGTDDFLHRIILKGDGAGRTIVMPAKIGGVLIDAAGCNNLRIEALTIDSGRVPSRAALLLGRTAASGNCNGGIFANLVIEGSYSIAAVVSIAAETTRWLDCRIANGHSEARHTCFVTGTDPAFITGLAGAGLVAGPNTDNVMTGCVFYAPHDRARLLRFSAGGGWTFLGCSLLAGDAEGARIAVYTDPVDNVFNGPIGWHGCHFEVTSRNSCVHWIEAPLGDSYWRHLAIHGGYAVVLSDTPLLDFDRRDPSRRPIIQSMLLQGIALPPGVSGADVMGFAFLDSDLTLLSGQGAIIALGFVRNCRIEANDLRTPQVAGRPVRVVRDGSRRQTFGSGMIVENTDPAQGEIGQWVVPRDGGGTIEAAGGSGASPRAGEILDIGGGRHVIWRSAPGKRPILDQSATASPGSGFAVPVLKKLGA